MTPEQFAHITAIINELAEVVHRCAVVFDDWLCQRWHLSRKPRGKHAIEKRTIDKR